MLFCVVHGQKLTSTRQKKVTIILIKFEVRQLLGHFQPADVLLLHGLHCLFLLCWGLFCRVSAHSSREQVVLHCGWRYLTSILVFKCVFKWCQAHQVQLGIPEYVSLNLCEGILSCNFSAHSRNLARLSVIDPWNSCTTTCSGLINGFLYSEPFPVEPDPTWLSRASSRERCSTKLRAVLVLETGDMCGWWL